MCALSPSTMNFRDDYTPFRRDFKKLKKRYATLEADFSDFKEHIEIYLGNPELSRDKHTAILHKTDNTKIVKTRMYCATLKSSDLRVVYASCEESGIVDFIEIFAKSDKDREDETRWKSYAEQDLRQRTAPQ